MNNWYVLFVKSGCEEKILHIIKERIDSKMYFPFIFLKKMQFKKLGIYKTEEHICFPGYIFIMSDVCNVEFLNMFYLKLNDINEIYRILNYGEKKDCILSKPEKLNLVTLFGNECCIDNSIGIMEGDIVKITSGALINMESKIKKINRHKRQAIIEVYIMGDYRQIIVGLEIIHKI